MIYDLNMSVVIDPSYEKTDEATLAQTNSFAQAGNVKPLLILEVFNPESRSQMFIHCAPESPYEDVLELTRAYAEDLGAVNGATDSNGTVWHVLTEAQEFGGLPCCRILSSFENVNAEYILLLGADKCAYIITLLTFNNQPPESELEGIEFIFDIPQPSAEQTDGEAAGESAPEPTADSVG